VGSFITSINKVKKFVLKNNMDIQNRNKQKVGTMYIELKVRTRKIDPSGSQDGQGSKYKYTQHDSDSVSLENEEEEYEEEVEDEELELEQYGKQSMLEDQIQNLQVMGQDAVDLDSSKKVEIEHAGDQDPNYPGYNESYRDFAEGDEESDDDPIPDDEDKVETVKPSIRDPEYMNDYRPKCEFLSLII